MQAGPGGPAVRINLRGGTLRMARKRMAQRRERERLDDVWDGACRFSASRRDPDWKEAA